MNWRVTTAALFLILLGAITPSVTIAQEDAGPSGWCRYMGWLVSPFGFCEPVPEVIVVETNSVETKEIIYHEPKPAPQPVVTPAVPAAPTTASPIIERVLTTEYVSTGGVTTAELNTRIAEVLTYVNTLLPQSAPIVVESEVESGDFITKEYLLKTLDRVSDQISDSTDDIFAGGEFESPTLIDAYLSGTTNTAGWLGVATSSPSDVLSVNGPIYLAATTPGNTSNRLYNFAGELYWNGSLLVSSTTGSWNASAGNVYRLNGNVGIGTSTPEDTLTVAGSIAAESLTAQLYDAGGQVCNVEAYGAIGDNVTDNYAAITEAIADCPEGGIVYFPIGQYRISETIVLDRPVTLRGAYAPRWSYSSTPRSSIRAAFGTFIGDSIIHVRDRTISGEVNHNNGGRLENLSIDGGSWGTDVHGVHFEGLVRDWKLTDVDISQTTGNGFLAEVGDGSGNPRGFTIRGLSIYSADGHGFRATALNDSYLEDVLTVGNALRGFYLSSMGETKVNNSRAVFNALEGLYIDGASNNGGIMFTDFSTDRNDRHGVRVSLTGTTTVTFNGLLTRRDGANLGGGSETPYAGVAIIGTTSLPVAPVFINGLAQIIGVDDSGNPPLAPLVGVRVVNALYVKVEGQLWGVDDAYVDGGGNQAFIIEDDSIIKTGSGWAADTPPPTFNNKWIASSTVDSLFYDGRVSIGSTTGSRLFNITAPAQSGARFIDTTNNVTFDMRAEDFQAFFGTFSNHQLRFQTNNVSRLTIDTSGNVGIGTTSPDQRLDVVGTIQASNLLGGAVNLTTDANGNIIRDPSDERLKTNVEDVTGALEKVLALRGVTYQWIDTERFGDQTEMGFLAQEVDGVVPEVVRKGGDYWSLNTRNLLAIVVEAIEEMWAVVRGNQARITELEQRVIELEAALQDENILEKEPVIENIDTTSQSENITASSTEAILSPSLEEEVVAEEELLLAPEVTEPAPLPEESAEESGSEEEEVFETEQ